ncbi:cytochrome B5 [Xylariomycetidae sp. FL2044]|nr:cytochrome B5 [Xylariomycetidae sp. FL2044]
MAIQEQPASGPEFTAKEIAAHRDASDAWMVIHGAAYDVSKYLHDHPGGAEILLEAAGTDATEAFDNAGHSEDAFEIMKEYYVGNLKGYKKKSAPKPIKSVIAPKAAKKRDISGKAVGGLLALSLGAVGIYYAVDARSVSRALIPSTSLARLSKPGHQGLGFLEGFLLASTIFGVSGGVLSQKLAKLVHFDSSFMNYAPHVKIPRTVKPDLLRQGGWLHPTTYQSLPLVKKTLIAPNTYRLVFELPTPNSVLGLPIGQHVAITNGQVTRSYTPVSNNADLGVLELVIKCYPNGLLTGGYLEKLQVGDEVQFRGPKGGMRYRRGLARKIGMLAGGSGITPMYQLIRAVCEDDRDTTEISLVYANRTEDDILLRDELDTFARRYPKNFKVYYMLDNPPAGWTQGSGFVTKDVMAERFPAPDPSAKVMICGPPGMVGAAKKALVDLGFEKPLTIPKMTDQVFCF